MKRTLAAILLLTMVFAVFAAKPEMKPYGFVKGDLVYATGGVASFGKSIRLAAAQVATGADTATVGLTAQHTRFGLNGKIEEGDITAGGKIELDFFCNAFDANGKPRIRQGFAWIKPMKGLDLRFGQQWDLFSPQNAATNNTNGNMWYAGNHGFRRAQIQARYGMDMGSMKPELQVSAGEGTKEAGAVGADNLSGIPLIQARLALGMPKKMTAGVAVVNGKYGVDGAYSTSGVGLDWNLPLHAMLALKGEFNIGTNLHNANMFSFVGAGNASTEKKSRGVWVNAISKISPKLKTTVGFGLEQNTSETINANDPESNLAAYLNLTMPMGGAMSIALEVEQIQTQLKDAAEANSATVIDIAGKIGF